MALGVRQGVTLRVPPRAVSAGQGLLQAQRVSSDPGVSQRVVGQLATTLAPLSTRRDRSRGVGGLLERRRLSGRVFCEDHAVGTHRRRCGRVPARCPASGPRGSREPTRAGDELAAAAAVPGDLRPGVRGSVVGHAEQEQLPEEVRSAAGTRLRSTSRSGAGAGDGGRVVTGRRGAGESTIVQDKRGRWHGYVSCGLTDNGKRDRRHVGASRRTGGLTFSEPKTTRGRRSIGLPPQVLTVLRQHRQVQLKNRLAAGPLWVDHDLVFCQASGSRSTHERTTETGRRCSLGPGPARRDCMTLDTPRRRCCSRRTCRPVSSWKFLVTRPSR